MSRGPRASRVCITTHPEPPYLHPGTHGPALTRTLHYPTGTHIANVPKLKAHVAGEAFRAGAMADDGDAI